MKNKPLVIVKLGGSAITLKDEDKPVVNSKNLGRLCREIADARKENVFSLVVVHGAGPFGHVPAKKHGIDKGLNNPSQIIGFSETHQSMEKLNYKVVETLRKEGIPAIAFQPSAGGILEDGKLVKFPVDVIKEFLVIGLVPVGYGDALIDRKKGINILSGDHLVTHLAEKLKADKVILVADVPGVFDRDPKKHNDARAIPVLSRKNINTIREIGTAKGVDVTGGMKRKLEELLHLADLGIESMIISGFVPGALRLTLEGETTHGTNIKRNT